MNVMERIATALARGATVAQCDELGGLTEPEKQRLRAQRAEITPAPLLPAMHPSQPERYRAAVLSVDTNALKLLDDERSTIDAMIEKLNALEAALIEWREQARLEDLRAAIPEACKKIPAAITRVESALSTFDGALAALNGLLESVGQYHELGQRRPALTDEQLTALFDLRDAVWRLRNVSVPYHFLGADDPEGSDFANPLWQRAYELVGDASAGRVRVRGRPGQIDLLDFLTPADDAYRPGYGERRRA